MSPSNAQTLSRRKSCGIRQSLYQSDRWRGCRQNELVIYQADSDLLEAIPNTKASIKQWLKALLVPVSIATGATNIYHTNSLIWPMRPVARFTHGGRLRTQTLPRRREDPRQNRRLGRQAAGPLPEEREPRSCTWTPPSPLYRQLLGLSRRRGFGPAKVGSSAELVTISLLLKAALLDK
nr:hypothetical protein [Pseudomonas baetica]